MFNYSYNCPKKPIRRAPGQLHYRGLRKLYMIWRYTDILTLGCGNYRQLHVVFVQEIRDKKEVQVASM